MVRTGFLTKELRHKDFQEMTTYAKFFDRYARQIDNLSVLNVDPVVLSYGAYVADSFRSVSAGLLDTNLQKVQDRSTYEAGSADYHGRGDDTNWNGYTSRVGFAGGGYDDPFEVSGTIFRLTAPAGQRRMLHLYGV